MDLDTNKKATKAGVGYVIGNYLLKGITFLSAPIFSRLLSLEGYGAFSTYFTFEAIMYIIIGYAMHTSLNSAKYKFKESLDEYVSCIVLVDIFSVIVWFIGANLFWDVYKDLFGYSRYILNLLLIHCFSYSLFQIYINYVGLSYSYISFLKLTYFNALSNIGLSIVLVLCMPDRKYEGRIMGAAMPIIFIGFYLIILFFRKSKPRIRKEFVSFAFKYSIPVMPHGISEIILASFDLVMIRRICGSADAGIYSFAFTINQIFVILSNSINNVWKPWVFEKMEEKSYDEITKKSSLYILGIACFALLILLVSPELIKILGPKEYWDSIDCVVPIVIGGYFLFLYSLPSTIEFYYQKTKYIAVASSVAALLNIALNGIFIPKYGYVAAAYTTVVTYCFYFIFHFCIAKKCNGFSLFEVKKIVLITSGLLVGGSLVMIFRDYWIVRWGMEFVLGVGTMIWLERTFRGLEYIKNRLSKSK